MAPNKNTSGKRDNCKGKIDQFFPRLSKGSSKDGAGNKDCQNGTKTIDHDNNDSSNSDSEHDDDQWNVSLSALIGQKRPRPISKPPISSSSRTKMRNHGAMPAVSSKQGAPNLKVKTKKNPNKAHRTASSEMIDTCTSTTINIAKNNNIDNSNHNRSDKDNRNKNIDLDDKVDDTTSNIPSSTATKSENNENHSPDANIQNATLQSTAPTSSFIRPAPVPSIRRCLGHAVADYIPPEPNDEIAKPHHHWLHRLFQRSIQGHRLHANSIPTSCHNWTKSPSSRVALSSPGTKIEFLAWDSLGTLLCVAGPRTIFIYDWDMLRTADMVSQSDRQRRRQSQARYQIPPLLQFSVPYAISRIQWNPYHPDQLAVGFKLQGMLHLYQLDAVLEWREKHPSSSLYPPRNCFQLFPPTTPPTLQGSVHAILFLPTKSAMVVSMGSTVYCWDLPSTILKWKFQPPSVATCLVAMNDSWILVATHQGQFIIIDTSKTERAALSLQYKPLVIHSWNPKTTQPPTAVLNCQILPLLNNHCFQLMWITEDGFVYQTTIIMNHSSSSSEAQSGKVANPSTNHSQPTTKSPLPRTKTTTTAPSGSKQLPLVVTYAPTTIIYAPPKVSIYNHAHQETIADNQYSIPPEPMISHYTPTAWIWPAVPKLSRYLCHHDKFVVDRMTIVRDPDRALLWYSHHHNQHGGKTVISIPASPPPQVVALHPDSEWIVMGVGTEVEILLHRSMKKTSIPKSSVEQPPSTDASTTSTSDTTTDQQQQGAT